MRVQVRRMASLQTWRETIVLVEAARTPFAVSGTELSAWRPHELLREAMRGVVSKSGVKAEQVDSVVAGSVIQEVRTGNVAREAALQAGIPMSVPAHTVTQACISANAAIVSVMGQIFSGSIRSGIAGGVESMSDVPIRFSAPIRKRMLASRRIKSFGGYLKLLSGLKLADLKPDTPPIAEFSTGETMGHSADRLAAAFGITRLESDEFAQRSHLLAAAAAAAGRFSDVVALKLTNGKSFAHDNGIRATTTLESLSSLKPAFVKDFGTVTAGNASFLTDGASAALIMTLERAKELGLKPKAILRQFYTVAQDPKDQLLLGPAYVIPKLLDATGLSLKNIGVWELHEAFAGQVLANLRALDSEWFCRTHMHRSQVGKIDLNLLNKWGGSLSLGHPFGATGVRLVNTTAERLAAEDKQFGIVAACAAGGLGHGMVVERC